MSLRKRLEDLTSGIGSGMSETGGADTTRRQPRTAPGQLLAFREAAIESERRVAELLERLKQFEGAMPAQKLDPRRIRPSRYPNRHKAHFDTAEFAALRDDIKRAGGNVQPIFVRPVSDDPSAEWEVVYGHRRHRACLDLGLDVLAIVGDVDVRTAWVYMFAENASRADLSPYECGAMYDGALKAGLFETASELAESVGRSKTHVSRSLAVYRLPPSIVAAFSSPLVLQFRWGVGLAMALAKDPDGVSARLERLADMKAAGEIRSDRDVYRWLVGDRPENPRSDLASAEAGQPTHSGGLSVKRLASGAVIFRVPAGVIHSDADLGALRDAVAKAIVG